MFKQKLKINIIKTFRYIIILRKRLFENICLTISKNLYVKRYFICHLINLKNIFVRSKKKYRNSKKNVNKKNLNKKINYNIFL